MKAVDMVLDGIAIIICVGLALGAAYMLLWITIASINNPWRIFLAAILVGFVAWRAYRSE